MEKIIKYFLALLNPYFGLLLLWVASESILMNAQLAYRKNHSKSEKFARWGGYAALLLAFVCFGKSFLS
jgi:hypothetical protein